MEIRIRPASQPDLAHVTRMTEDRRVQYQEYQPVFWRKAEDSAVLAGDFMAKTLAREDALFLVAESDERILGFLVATEISAPPVYDPGGKVCFIDDFVVDPPELWGTVGRALAEAAFKRAKPMGAAIGNVVCGPRDTSKRATLIGMGFTVAGEWHVLPLPD